MCIIHEKPNLFLNTQRLHPYARETSHPARSCLISFSFNTLHIPVKSHTESGPCRTVRVGKSAVVGIVHLSVQHDALHRPFCANFSLRLSFQFEPMCIEVRDMDNFTAFSPWCVGAKSHCSRKGCYRTQTRCISGWGNGGQKDNSRPDAST